jgi:hypothetical protein
MDERTVSTKAHSLCLLLQVTFALSHACIEHDKENLCQNNLNAIFSSA